MTLDGIRIEEFGLKALLEHEHPLNAEITHKTVKIPGRDGLYYFGSEIGGKVFSITFDVIEDDKIEMQRKLNAFVAFLYDSYSQPRSIKVVFDYEPDVYYMIRINSSITPSRMYGLTQFSLPFVAYDPYKYSVVLSDEITWGSEVITFESHYLLGHECSDGLTNITSPTLLNILVDGLAIKPVIEITGSATNLALNTNGYSISVGTFNNASWVIDCIDYTVKKDGVSAFNSVGLRDFILLPDNNQVSITGTGLNLSIRIKSRDKYI